MRLSGGASGTLRVRIGGQPVDNGGLSMTGSQVDLVAGGTVFDGTITALQGQQFTAHVRSPEGSRLLLQAHLRLDAAAGTVSGSLQAQPSGAS
jgi:hypothetical protein